MRLEIKSAVEFFTHILSIQGSIPPHKLEKFSQCLEALLYTKFEQHWHPQKPMLGSAFRCIRITQKHMDTDIDKAASMSDVTFAVLVNALPREFTMWIDPEDVSYRIGEEGSICSIFNKDGNNTGSQTDSGILNQSCHSEVSRATLISSPNESTYTQCWS
ncbi:protein BTG1-like [Hydractinia symbiolongicarpus]|uniref:protein BTG1-like n=1 Tax=Hydractinia symbiolongicarpus TaxID=13093 RepID=UPI00254F8486|nr:protein BTG1-like [Hydractinia symbiolongicarpus]